MIEQKLHEKDTGAVNAKENLLANSIIKREIRQLQHLEVMEKRSLNKQISFAEKRRLVLKQEQIRENYEDWRKLQQDLQQMRIANDMRKQEILSHRSEQVKFLKDNYLNQ